MKAQPKPKKEWHLRNGVVGQPGPGRPKGVPGRPKPRPLGEILAAVAKEQNSELRKDLAAEIAHAVFVGNADAIYRAMSKGLLKGDLRVFTALANRAYGLPAQETTFSEQKPFRLEIEVIGQKGRQVIGTTGAIDGEEVPQKNAQEPPAERLLRSASTPENSDDTP